MKRKICASIFIAFFLIFFVASAATLACIPPPPSMVAWWPGDGKSDDVIGHRDTMWVEGGAYEDGIVEQAFSFDGDQDFINAPSGFNVLHAFTIDAWVKPHSFPPGIMRYVSLIPDKVILRYNGGNLEFYMVTGPGFDNWYQISYPVPYPPHTFYHIAGTYDGEFMRLYLDGQEVVHGSAQGSVNELTDVQMSNYEETLHGLLDEVEIYDRALSAAEIQDIYLAGSEGKCKPAPTLDIDWFWVQHRVYEDGKDFNRLGFSLRYEDGSYPLTDVVRNVTLTDNHGNSVPYRDLRFWSEENLFGRYDGWAGTWSYDEFQFESGHTADIDDPLVEGTYNLTITDLSGNTYESEYKFNGLVNLPIISRYFFYVSRKSKNLVWRWHITPELYHLGFTYETQVRAIIEIYNNNQYVGAAWLTTPTHMGKIIIPPGVVEKIASKGNRFDFIMQLRTRDNNNRTYSKDRRAKLFRKFCKDDDDYDDSYDD
jgi:hypothetical protein